MTELTATINGKKYLAFEYPVGNYNSTNLERLVRKYDCITQGVVNISRGGFFGTTILIMRILVPEENVIAFDKES